MKIFFASFFICLVLICGVMLLGALFGGFGLLLLASLRWQRPSASSSTSLKPRGRSRRRWKSGFRSWRTTSAGPMNHERRRP